MLPKFFTFLCLAIIILSGCKKEMTAQNNSLSSEFSTNTFSEDASVAGVVDTSKGWFGGYAGYYGPYPTVPDSILIKSGVAKDPAISQSFSYSNISYDIPAGYDISGDSLYFEATVKNPVKNSFNDYDIVLQIFGSNHSAELHYVADAASQYYDQVLVGNTRISGIPQLVHYFPDFEIVKFIMKNKMAYVFLNDSLLYQFKYGAENSIGNVERINVAGKGFAICDKVRLFSSYTHRRLLTEDFNTRGKSHTILYQ